MTARSPSAFLLSALLHGLVVLLILLLAYLANDQLQPAPKILELVAGAGNNYGATVAPALGTHDGVKLSVPIPPAPTPVPAVIEPPAPIPTPAPVVEKTPVTPSPITPAPEPVPTKPVSVKKTPAPTATTGAPRAEKTPNFANDVKRIANKRAANLDAKYRKQLEAERQRALKAEQAAAKVKHIDENFGSKGGVVGGSVENKTGAGNKALTREESDLTDLYFALLKARLKENHEKPPGLSDTLTAKVAFFVAADGTISRARIVKSSQSAEFDRSVLEAIRHTESIGKRPDGRSEEITLDFKMRDEETG